MNTFVRPLRRTVFVVASLALALAGWACAGSSSSVSSSSGSTGAGGMCPSSGSGAGGGPPMTVAKMACDSSKDIYAQCPLPPSQNVDDGYYTTVWYFSDPACQGGFCTYCVTSTESEDPCDTAVCQ